MVFCECSSVNGVLGVFCVSEVLLGFSMNVLLGMFFLGCCYVNVFFVLCQRSSVRVLL